jgi:Leucine-rich repeat (LRR) protein
MPLSLFTVDELRAATDDFAASSFIGAGGCGRVFRGTLASGESVAVKRWTVGTDVQLSLMELMTELYTLGRIAHRNLLPVLGFVCQSPELMLVTLHMPRGSLHDALHGGNTAGVGIDAAWRISFLLGLARGIQALHDANFVHRDVKSANVLIGDDGRAVLADAGVARRMRVDADATAEATGTRVIGTDGYLDPEYLDTMELTYKSDVFSVGVVILEMLTGRPARDPSLRPPLLWRCFRSIRSDDWDERVGRVVTEAAACLGGASPRAGPVVALASLALRATAESSASRPSIDVVISTLEEIPVDGVGGGDGVDESHVRMCMVCLCEPRVLRFACGHMTTCGGCVARWPDCLLCNDFTGSHLNLEANPRDQTYERPAPLRRSAGANIVSEPATGPAPGNGGSGGGGGGGEPALRECVVCLSAVRSVRFDCGHMVTCSACTGLLLAESAPRCPQCRAPASVAAQLTADPLDPTYHVAPPVTVQPGGARRGEPDELSACLVELRLSAFETELRAFGVASPNDLADVEDAELGEMGVKPLKIRQLRRTSCAMVGGGCEEALAPFLAELRLVDVEVKLRDLGVATPDDLADVEDAELAEMGVKPFKMRHLRRALCAVAGGGDDGGGEQDADQLVTFLAKLLMDDYAVTLRDFGVATPEDLAEVEDAELAEMGIRPLKMRQLRKALMHPDEAILRLWRNQCPALQTLWPADADVTTWEGVEFAETDAADASGRGSLVVTIKLEGKLGDTTEVPAALGNLTALTTLYLNGNRLTSLPAELERLPALTDLWLEENQLRSLPAGLWNLTALTCLQLHENQLTSLPAELGMLTALTGLSLNGNQLTSLPAVLGMLTALTALTLHENQLTSLPAELGMLTALTLLTLNGNQLTSLPAELVRLTALTVLTLHDNQLTSLPAELGMLTALTLLTLNGNQLTSLPAGLWNLTVLTCLKLHEIQLTSLPAELGMLTALTGLTLHENQLTSLPAELGMLTALTELSLNANQLTSLPAELGRLTALTELSLNGNQLTSLPAELVKLTALTMLTLHDNQLTSLPAGLGMLTVLTTLTLHANRLTSLPAELVRLTALTVLFLNENRLTSLPAGLGMLTALTMLRLEENQLTSLPAELGRLTTLTELSLEKNQLTSLPAELGMLTALTELSLFENQLTSLPAELVRLTALTELTLNDNQLTSRRSSVCSPR